MAETTEDLQIRTRMSLRQLMKNEEKLNSFLRAWKRIQELPPDNPNSFWTIAGYHGLPFVTNQIDASLEADGFCQHENVLFPLWHRFYLLRIEQALQTVCPGEDVCMHYWDETSEETLEHGLPPILTDEKVYIDGVLEDNPLRSFILPRQLGLDEMKKDNVYYKPKGYVTKRYPSAGIECDLWKTTTDNHNRNIGYFLESDQNVTKELNKLIINWLTKSGFSTYKKYAMCLNTPTYNSFSNKVSASDCLETSLEQPHDDIHLALGGFEGQIQGTSGDMGVVETAAFDPVFFFHHCFIDRVFWLWQVRHGATENLEITPDDEGARVSDPTPFQKTGHLLTMDALLHPFQLSNGLTPRARDGISIVKMGYRYSKGSLEEDTVGKLTVERRQTVVVSFEKKKPTIASQIASALKKPQRVIFEISGSLEPFQLQVPKEIERDNERYEKRWLLKVENFNRKNIRGSFVMLLFWKNPTKPENNPELVGRHAEFRRWREDLCSNCLTRPKNLAISFDVTDCATRNKNYLTSKEFSIQIVGIFGGESQHLARNELEDAKAQSHFRLFRSFTARENS